jgi:hypothetical protein
MVNEETGKSSEVKFLVSLSCFVSTWMETNEENREALVVVGVSPRFGRIIDEYRSDVTGLKHTSYRAVVCNMQIYLQSSSVKCTRM